MDVTICNPTGNITALVTTAVPVACQPFIAGEIMKKDPSVEQVGFVAFGEDAVSLRMAGGEFCGNATMSAAALYGKSVRVNDIPVRVTELEAAEEKRYLCSVRMPEPKEVTAVMLDGLSLPLVDLGSIAHLICTDRASVEDPEKKLPMWCKMLGYPALGLMFLEGDQLTPLVYVADIDSLFWESSCASGTASVGFYNGRAAVYREPAGNLEVSFDEAHHLWLTGIVAI